MSNIKIDGGKNKTVFGHGVMGTSCGAKGIKIENEEEKFKHEKISLPMSKRIQRARIEAGLSQKELAQKINMRSKIIQDYEKGTAIPIGRIIQMIEKACNIPFGTIAGKKKKVNKTNMPKRKKKKKCKLKLIKT